MYTYFLANTNSGIVQQAAFPSEGNWRRVMNSVGSGEHFFQLRDRPDEISLNSWRAMWRELTQPWANTLIVCWNDIPVYAGVITSRKYHRPSGVLSVRHSEVRVILAKRHPFGVDQYEVGTLTVAGKSLRGAVRAVIYECFGPKSARWEIPISYPADEVGTYSNTWHNYTFPLGEKILADLQNLEDGPDIDFQPRWTAEGRLEWLLRIGSPRLTHKTFAFAPGAEESSALDVGLEDDATRQLTGVLTIGKGSEVDIMWGRAPETGGSVIPFLDTSRPYTSIGDQDKLNSYARSELATFREPTTQYTMSVLASQYPGAEQLVPGSDIELQMDGDEFIPDGPLTQYLLGLSGDTLTENLTLELQEA